MSNLVQFLLIVIGLKEQVIKLDVVGVLYQIGVRGIDDVLPILLPGEVEYLGVMSPLIGSDDQTRRSLKGRPFSKGVERSRP